MIVKCLYNKGSDLGTQLPGRFYYTPETVFDLQPDREYPVFGLGIWQLGLVALVLDETGKPNWLPVGLFDFDAKSLPPDWEFVVRDWRAAVGSKEPTEWVAMWGYSELVRDISHSDRLIEREPEALEVFFREVAKQSANGNSESDI